MAQPILNLVRPGRGWSAGGTLIQLDGNDFRVRAPTRSASGPVPAPRPSVEVLFGDVPSPRVEVVSSAILRVLTPPHAPDRQTKDGVVLAQGTVDVVVRNLDDDGNPIPGESVTLPSAYTFTRPQLGTKQVRGAWLRVIDGFLNHWRNIALENVLWNPSVDYDAETGDVRGYVRMAELPGIAVTRVAFPDSALEAEGGPVEVEIDDTLSLLRQVPVASDMTFTLVLVSNNEGELVNLCEVVKSCFRHAPFFRVPIDVSGTVGGEAEFVMMLTNPIQLAERIGSTNIVTAEAPGIVFQLVTLDVPGTPPDALPGVPRGVVAQSARSVVRRLEKLGVNFVPIPKREEP